MKRRTLILLPVFMLVILWACQAEAIQSFRSRLAGAKPKVDTVASEEVDPVLQIALYALEEARAKRLHQVPCVKTGSHTRIDCRGATETQDFTRNGLVVTGFHRQASSAFSLDAVIESIGPSGRIDLSRNHMVFNVCKADSAQRSRIKKALLDASKGMRDCPPEIEERCAGHVLACQKDLGLAPDGRLTDKTAEDIAGDLPVLEIQEITSGVLYPEKPRHVVFILPKKTVAANGKALLRGIDSLQDVRKHAIPSTDFRAHARKGGDFVLFVFFLDRVSPAKDLRTGFSRGPGSPPDSLTPRQYPVAGAWPVLVEPFHLGPLADSDPLYLHVLLRGFPVAEIRIL